MEQSQYQVMKQVADKHWWFVARRFILAAMLKRLRLPEQAKILEIGCAGGENFSMLAQFGEVYGAEMDEMSCKNALAKGVAKSVEPAVLPETVPYQGQTFDVVTMFDVLEHIEQDQASLEAIAAHYMDEKSYLLITVPAYQFMWSKHDEQLHHKRRYTKSSLKRVSEDAGLSVKFISYFNCLLFPIAFIVRQFGKLRGEKGAVNELSIPSKPVNNMLQNIFMMEATVLKRYVRLPFGLSIMAIMQKPAHAL